MPFKFLLLNIILKKSLDVLFAKFLLSENLYFNLIEIILPTKFYTSFLSASANNIPDICLLYPSIQIVLICLRVLSFCTFDHPDLWPVFGSMRFTCHRRQSAGIKFMARTEWQNLPVSWLLTLSIRLVGCLFCFVIC